VYGMGEAWGFIFQDMMLAHPIASIIGSAVVATAASLAKMTFSIFLSITVPPILNPMPCCEPSGRRSAGRLSVKFCEGYASCGQARVRARARGKKLLQQHGVNGWMMPICVRTCPWLTFAIAASRMAMRLCISSVRSLILTVLSFSLRSSQDVETPAGPYKAEHMTRKTEPMKTAQNAEKTVVILMQSHHHDHHHHHPNKNAPAC
jgi:hypothetical protein